MAKKKYKEKVRTVYVQPTDEQVQRAIIETTPMKEEMESWMGCKTFTLSCVTLHETVEEMITHTQILYRECMPEWFADHRSLCEFMTAYLEDVEKVLKMVSELKLLRKHEESEGDETTDCAD